MEKRVKTKIAAAVPNWAAFKVSDHATYLGYVLGPGAGQHPWTKPVAKWAERAAEIARASPPVRIARQQYVVKALPVLDYVAAMSVPPSDIKEIYRRVVQTLWHLPGNFLPGEGHVEMAEWGCPAVQSAEARMRAVAARAAACTNTRWPDLYARLEAAADGVRSLAEMAKGVVTPRWWDNAACVEVLRAAAAGWPGYQQRAQNDAAADAAQRQTHARPQSEAQNILTSRVRKHRLATAAQDRLRRLGVQDVPRPDAARWQEIRTILAKSFAGCGALACIKSWLNAWTTTKRMHDARPLSCPFGCAGDDGTPIADDMSHCLHCEPLWNAAARAAGDSPRRSAVERLALGDALDWDARVGAIARLVCAFGIYLPDAGRDAAHAEVSQARMREHERVAADRLPDAAQSARSASANARQGTRARARAPTEWT